MGQRHQLCAVAKINSRYRTLAVTHHQWLCGSLVVERCLFILEVFRRNRRGVQRELRRATKLDWDRDIPKDKDGTSVPFFPFLTNALFLGTTSGGGSLNTPSVFLLSLNTIPHDTVNVDGFTIIDITDPAIPRYAFFLDEELMGPSKYVNPSLECPALYERGHDLIQTKLGNWFVAGYKAALPASIFPNGTNTSFPLGQVFYIRQRRLSENPRLQGGGLHWERLLQSYTIDVNLSGIPSNFSDRDQEEGPNVLAMPVRDALLSTEAIAVAIPKRPVRMGQCPRVLSAKVPQASGWQYRWASRHVNSALLWQTVADTFQDDLHISPFPAHALAEWRTSHSNSLQAAPLAPLVVSSTWSLVVFDEYIELEAQSTFGPQKQTEVRYAFYTTLEDGSLKVVDSEGFFANTARRNDFETAEQQATHARNQWIANVSRLDKTSTVSEDSGRNGRR